MLLKSALEEVVHSARNPVKAKVGDTTVCKWCKTDFVQRFRLIAHLSDSRPARSACRLKQLSEPDLPHAEVEQLNEHDARLQSDERRTGRTHAIAQRPATR